MKISNKIVTKTPNLQRARYTYNRTTAKKSEIASNRM